MVERVCEGHEEGVGEIPAIATSDHELIAPEEEFLVAAIGADHIRVVHYHLQEIFPCFVHLF